MVRLIRPGSFAWLVLHDVRINWRRFADMIGGGRGVTAVALAFAGGLLLHALAWPAIPYLSPFFAGQATSGDARVLLGGLVVSVACWMVAQGLFTATRTLYDRGDLDLLLGAPVPRHRILAAKATAIVLSSLGSVAMLVLPVANVGALREGLHWLSIYPTLASVAMIATSMSLVATIVLFRLFGPRRARLSAHIAGALIGGAFVLLAQIVAMLPVDVRDLVTRSLAPASPGTEGALSAVLWLPVRALLGEPSSIVVLLGIGLVCFGAATALLGESFANASLEAGGAPDATVRMRRAKPMTFRRGARAALIRKEWRLLLRDPSLFAQLGLQIVYTIPLAVVLIRAETLPLAVALAPTIVVISAQVAASLAWIAVSGEDAPELIETAPVTPASVDRSKLSAIALPVLLVAALPVACLALMAPLPALVALGFAVAGSLSTALLNLWHPMPGNRRGMLRRHAQSKLVGLIEHALAILWAIACVLALMGSQLWMIPAAIAVAVLYHGRLGKVVVSARGATVAAASSPARS